MWVDARTQKLRKGGRTVNLHALIAVSVDTDGHRPIFGMDVDTAVDSAAWCASLRSLIARDLPGVQVVVSEAHTSLVDATGADLADAV